VARYLCAVENPSPTFRAATPADAPALTDLINRAYRSEELAGHLAGCVYLEPQGQALYLSMLAVAPEVQAHGLGRQLLSQAEAHARQAGCASIKISVLALRSELLAWYERQGYRRTGASEPFPDTTRFGRPRQPLTLLALEKTLVNG
jgi:ribosomal protein S18 acetylase RimI-like enzyme